MEDFVVYNNYISQEELKKLNIFISNNAVVQNGAKIYFNSCIIGDSVVYSTAVIHSNSTVINSVIRAESIIYSSRIEDSELDAGCVVGPFAHIKDNCKLGKNCKVGNFSVVKNSELSDNVSIAHLALIENAEIDRYSIVRSGVVFSSNDSKILIGDNVAIGENSSIIAPVEISDEAVVGVGCVVNKNVGVKEFASNKPKQTNSTIN